MCVSITIRSRVIKWHQGNASERYKGQGRGVVEQRWDMQELRRGAEEGLRSDLWGSADDESHGPLQPLDAPCWGRALGVVDSPFPERSLSVLLGAGDSAGDKAGVHCLSSLGLDELVVDSRCGRDRLEHNHLQHPAARGPKARGLQRMMTCMAV